MSATSEKLDALRSAAQQAFTQQQFDALQREIIDTEQSLRDYQRQLEELSDSSDDLDEALTDTADGADDADDSMKSLNKTADQTEGSCSIAKGAVATFVGNALTSLVSTAVNAAQTIGVSYIQWEDSHRVACQNCREPARKLAAFWKYP